MKDGASVDTPGLRLTFGSNLNGGPESKSEDQVDAMNDEMDKLSARIQELEKEMAGLRWMIQYSIDAPDEKARLKILQDALNGVRGAENVKKVDSEIARLRKALGFYANADNWKDHEELYLKWGNVAIKALKEGKDELHDKTYN